MVASVNVKMVDPTNYRRKNWLPTPGYNNGKILFEVLFSPFFWILYFPMDLASGKIELSERYIQKLKCGHTLQSYNVVVLWRNNAIKTPSVTEAIVFNMASEYPLSSTEVGQKQKIENFLLPNMIELFETNRMNHFTTFYNGFSL